MEAANHNENVPKAKVLFSARMSLATMCMFATLSFMFQRLTINFGLICMVKTTTPDLYLDLDLNNTLDIGLGQNYTQIGDNFTQITSLIIENDECQFLKPIVNDSLSNTTNRFEEGIFDWSRDVQGLILASFYYGFAVGQIPGGWCSDRFGAKLGLIWSVIVVSLLTLLTPIASYLGPEYLIALRLLQGGANGASMPAVSSLSSRWFADIERGFMMGIAYAGFGIAVAIAYPISAFFCQFTGWPYLFYFAGGTGITWAVVTHFLVFDWPENHPRISPKELQFIQKHRAVQYGGKSRQKLRVPWRQILTSMPVWSLLVANFCCFWVFLTVSMYLPTYLKEVLHLDISENGMLSALPFIAMMTFHFIVAIWFDRIRKKKLCSVTLLRKVFNTFGMLGSALCMALIGIISCSNHLGAIFLITGGQVLLEFAFMGGYIFSIFEVAPKFASVLTAVMNTFGLLGGLLSPPLVSYLTPNGSRSEWLLVFYISAAISGFGGLFYLIFGSSELQNWASSPPSPVLDTVPFSQYTKVDKEMKVLQIRLIDGDSNINGEVVKN